MAFSKIVGLKTQKGSYFVKKYCTIDIKQVIREKISGIMDEFKVNNDFTKSMQSMKAIQNTMAGFEWFNKIFSNSNNLEVV